MQHLEVRGRSKGEGRGVGYGVIAHTTEGIYYCISVTGMRYVPVEVGTG